LKAKNIQVVILIAAVAISIFCTIQIIRYSAAKKTLDIHYAELINVKYGLLNPDQWKAQINSILSKKIDAFDMTADNINTAKSNVEQLLYFAIDEAEKINAERSTQSLEGLLRSTVTSFAIDFDDIRRNVPTIAQDIINKFRGTSDLVEFKGFLKQILQNYLFKKGNNTNMANYNAILALYKQNNAEQCKQLIASQSKQHLNTIIMYAIILLALFACLIIFYWYHSTGINYASVTCASICLLLCGVSTPMISLDARISQLSISFLGENLQFLNQGIFYQSKSILDVFWILISSGTFSAVLIGILIVLFSVIIPLCKIIAASIIKANPAQASNKFLSFIAYKLSKWSMADVFVVAIFMAYLGFNAVINNQLQKVNSSSVEILTTNNTCLELGFVLFLAYVVGGVMMGGGGK
jgi:fumarate reductase subunit D